MGKPVKAGLQTNYAISYITKVTVEKSWLSQGNYSYDAGSYDAGSYDADSYDADSYDADSYDAMSYDARFWKNSYDASFFSYDASKKKYDAISHAVFMKN